MVPWILEFWLPSGRKRWHAIWRFAWTHGSFLGAGDNCGQEHLCINLIVSACSTRSGRIGMLWFHSMKQSHLAGTRRNAFSVVAALLWDSIPPKVWIGLSLLAFCKPWLFPQAMGNDIRWVQNIKLLSLSLPHYKGHNGSVFLYVFIYYIWGRAYRYLSSRFYFCIILLDC